MTKYINAFIKYYRSDRCIACNYNIYETLSFFSQICQDNLISKSSIVFCKKCGLGYAYPFLEQSTLNKLYRNFTTPTLNKKTQFYVTYLYGIINKLEEVVFKKIISIKSVTIRKICTSFIAPRLFQGFPLLVKSEKNKKLKILDYGYGNGYFLQIVHKAGHKAYGFDVNTQLVERLNRSGIIATGNLNDFIKRKIKFDVIRANQVFEHIKNPNEVLPKLHKMLKKDGELIICVPNFNTPAKIFRKYYHAQIPYHRLFYTKKSVELILNSNNFDTKYMKTKSLAHFSWALLGVLKMRSSYVANLFRLFDTLVLSTLLDAFKIGDSLEVYTKKKHKYKHIYYKKSRI